MQQGLKTGSTILSRKRSHSNGHGDEVQPNSKKCLMDTDENTETDTQQTYCSDPKICVSANSSFSELISFWADTQSAAKKVLHYLQTRQTIEDIFLHNSVNKKFLEFHHDITEECGAEDKQHSWAVIEKLEEVVMYGPYYPNYNKGEHSEDTVIGQTQELLESNGMSHEWKVYVFTMNSPCMARNVEPCMLKFVQKAQEWWMKFKVKTYVGYKRCWGFKGTKETVFRVVNYNQVKAIEQSENYEDYVRKVQNQISLSQLCENIYSLVKRQLNSGPVRFTLSLHGLEWKSYFKGMQSILESPAENDKELLAQKISKMTEAVQCLSPETHMSFEQYLERGHAFALDYSFNSEITEDIRDQMRLVFKQCWREMIQDKYADFIRETLTENFNKCTNQLFIKNFERLTESFLQIGRVNFTEKISNKNVSVLQ